jgi:hypothetical protein
MAHWNEVLPPNVMLDVQYEELVADVEGQSRRMIAHCGLEWDPRCLNFHQTERPVRTASAVQVRQPIYKTSVGRGRKYEAFLGPLFSTLGPTLSYHPSEGETRAVAAGPLEKLANVVRTMIRRISSSPMS